MQTRSLLLFRLFLSSLANKLRYDLIKELVVGVCILVLGALFVYIFQDFLNVKLTSLDDKARHRFGVGFSLVFLTITSLLVGRQQRRWKLEFASIENCAARQGESPSTIRYFVFLKTVFVHLLAFSGCWYIVLSYLHQFSLLHSLYLQIIFSLLAFAFLIPKKSRKDSSRYQAIKLNRNSVVANLVHWRLAQIVFRNPLSRICLASSLVFVLVTCASGALNLPFSVAILGSMVVSFLAAGSLVFQLEEDMKHIWLERSLGVSHNQFTKSYLLLGLMVASVLGPLQLLFYGLASSQIGVAFDPQILKLLVICTIGPLSVAPLMFQIDPRRPFIQFTTVFFVCLFLGTGIFAHWLSVLMGPILIHYGLAYQKNSFYSDL